MVSIGIKQNGKESYEGILYTINPNTAEAVFEIGMRFRIRVEFKMQKLIMCSVARMLDEAKVTQGTSADQMSTLSINKKKFEDKSAGYSFLFTEIGQKADAQKKTFQFHNFNWRGDDPFTLKVIEPDHVITFGKPNGDEVFVVQCSSCAFVKGARKEKQSLGFMSHMLYDECTCEKH